MSKVSFAFGGDTEIKRDDLVDAARAAPGKITYGYSAAGSRMPCELFKMQAKLDLLGIA